ncbi:upstream-binding factor 1-like protein 1 [Mercenaria mercenaria]|uniref:upstream-binding factor 1-like protein 1 n=1 Tax=Mercenaria mercenaria TaxID=6596 RepID=UPI00234E56F4|nr:upstream-binding factor 1-like protein 1 [Mercenaria mercenaria]
MSSDGEEVEVEINENHIDDGQAKNFHWHNDHVRKLARFVMSKLAEGDDLAPYDTVSIDWNNVEEEVGVDAEKCQRKWKLLMNSVRTYRTMPEIVLDILSQNSRTEITKNNKHQVVGRTLQSHQTKDGSLTVIKKKKKRKINPDHPKRPKVSGYSIFCSEMVKKYTHISGIPLMLQLGALWKQLPEDEKMRYNLACTKEKEAYLVKVEEYAKQHPEDLEIKEILAEETAKMRKPKRSRSKKSTTKRNETEKEQRDFVMADEKVDEKVSTNESDSILETPKKSPKKKRHNEEDSQDSSPSKKKKKKTKKEKVWTAEEMFIETKIDGYRLDHADMDDDDIREKLIRKFNKLSEEKKAKYKRKAEENS